PRPVGRRRGLHVPRYPSRNPTPALRQSRPACLYPAATEGMARASCPRGATDGAVVRQFPASSGGEGHRSGRRVVTRAIRTAALVLFPIVAFLASESLAGAQAQVQEQTAARAELRETYFAAIDQKAAIDEGLEMIERLERGDGLTRIEPTLL